MLKTATAAAMVWSSLQTLYLFQQLLSLKDSMQSLKTPRLSWGGGRKRKRPKPAAKPTDDELPRRRSRLAPCRRRHRLLVVVVEDPGHHLKEGLKNVTKNKKITNRLTFDVTITPDDLAMAEMCFLRPLVAKNLQFQTTCVLLCSLLFLTSLCRPSKEW